MGPKSPAKGLAYGLLYGVAVGIGMGYGSYSVMPIPHVLALAWLVGTVVEGAAAGLLVGLRVREAKPKVAGA